MESSQIAHFLYRFVAQNLDINPVYVPVTAVTSHIIRVSNTDAAGPTLTERLSCQPVKVTVACNRRDATGSCTMMHRPGPGGGFPI